jgi:hypothetical protein
MKNVKADRYATSLAAEFYVLSLLFRLGADANLTLANRKEIDIVVVRPDGSPATIDVKGTAGGGAWYAPRRPRVSSNHFFVFLDFCGRIRETDAMPEVFVVPSRLLKAVTVGHPRSFSTINKGRLARFRSAWTSMRI